jgi:Tfp pilus assembly protein PilX
MRHARQENQRGSIILVFLLTLPFLIMMAMYYMHLSLTSFQVARFDQLHTEAQLAADAGADYAVEQISQDNTWSGTASDVQLQNANNVRTTFSATVSGDSDKKTVEVTGKTYWPASSTNPNRTVKIAVDLRPVKSGSYSLVTGEGGLVMDNNAKIVSGDVFVNGTIALSNSAQIGLSTSPVSVEVADQACPQPADSTYPRVCASGEGAQPIDINNSAHIYATVKATNQTDGSNMSDNGLVANSTVAPKSLPSYDRAAQEAAVVNNLTGSQASCSGSQNITWQANTKITGNVTLSNQCKVTVKGNVWITGNLNASNSSQLIVDDSLGSTVPNIMIDGSGGAVFSNSAKLVSNSSDTGFEIYTFYSKASCSPDCSSVTGTDLANSRSVTTISLSNNSSAPNTTFYAYWSKVQIANAGQIGAIIGQTVELSNNSAITFGNSTALGGPTTWVIDGYRHLY